MNAECGGVGLHICNVVCQRLLMNSVGTLYHRIEHSEVKTDLQGEISL